MPTRVALYQVWALAVIYAVGTLAFSPYKLEPITENTLQILLVLWQVQAGMAAIALPLLLFVIETTRVDNPVGGLATHEVLLRETSLFPILAGAMAATAVVGGLLAFAASHTLLVPCAALLLATIVASVHAFYRALRLTFSRRLLRSATLRLLREQMSHSVRRSALLRIANNLLPEHLEVAGIRYDPFSRSQDTDAWVVFAPTTGAIADLDVIRLQRLGALLAEARLRLPDEGISTPGILSLNLRARPEVPSSAQWMVKCGDQVKAGKTPLLRIQRDRYVDLDLDGLRHVAQHVATIEDSADALAGEFGSLRDTAIDAVRQRRTRLLEHHLDVYDVLLRSFSDSLKRWEANYDAVSAAKEDTQLFSRGWTELAWIEADLLEISAVSIDEDSFELLRQILDSTYGLSLYAVGEREFYLYRHSLIILTQIYSLAIARGQAKLVERVAERVAFVLGELGDYKVATTAEVSSTIQDVAFVEQASKALLEALASLMRVAIDNGRQTDFSVFAKAEAKACERIVSSLGGERNA